MMSGMARPTRRHSPSGISVITVIGFVIGCSGFSFLRSIHHGWWGLAWVVVVAAAGLGTERLRQARRSGLDAAPLENDNGGVGGAGHADGYDHHHQ